MFGMLAHVQLHGLTVECLMPRRSMYTAYLCLIWSLLIERIFALLILAAQSATNYLQRHSMYTAYLCLIWSHLIERIFALLILAAQSATNYLHWGGRDIP